MGRWNCLRLEELAQITKGRVLPTSRETFRSAVRYLGASDIEGRDAGFFVSEENAVICKPDDVLMLWDGERSGLVGCGLSGAASSTVSRIRPDGERVEGRYLYHHLRQRFGLIQSLRTGTGVPHVPRDLQAFLQVPVPPLEEQRQIAEILDAIDLSIRATERVLAKLALTRSGLSEHLCAPWVQDTTAARLSDVVEAVVDCPHSTPDYRHHGILVARTMHIRDRRFLVSEASRVSEEIYRERVERMVPSFGDVVLTREAPVGEAFAIPEDMKICLGQRVVLIRPLQVLLGKFLVELIYSGQGRRQLRRLVVGTTNPHLNVDDIRSLTFGIPPLHEQRHAMRALDALDERLEVENQELAKLRQVRVGLAEDLLSGRVRTVAA